MVGYKGTTYQLMGKVSIDDANKLYVDGTMTSPQGDARFTFYATGQADETAYALDVTPCDALREPVAGEAEAFEANRNVPAESTTHALRDAGARRSILGDRTLQPFLIG
jgi:hypothetical protein